MPDVPVRQFVLSLPYELRLLAAFKPDVLSAIARIFVEAVFASYRALTGCGGNMSCNVVLDNALCTDPCVGTPKSWSVTVTCN